MQSKCYRMFQVNNHLLMHFLKIRPHKEIKGAHKLKTSHLQANNMSVFAFREIIDAIS